MQHHAHVPPSPLVAPVCTQAGAGLPPPRNIPHMQSKVAHINGNATVTHQHKHLPPYQPHQTSVQMQKIRQQHQHINYQNNNNNNNNNQINKNANYNNYNNLNNQTTVQPKHILSRNANVQQQQQQLATATEQIVTATEAGEKYNNAIASTSASQTMSQQFNVLVNQNRMKYNNYNKQQQNYRNAGKKCWPQRTTKEVTKDDCEGNGNVEQVAEKQPELKQADSDTTTKNEEPEENTQVEQSDGDNNNNILSNEDESVSKNSKEKTPMCLVNELARFNKITHQYRLTSENGPAHCKRFTVTLKLGEEEYSADGFKIKKAQHMAAAQAIEQTKYKHPIPKTLRRNEEINNARSNITPTVALNALAMKLGQPTYYLFDPRQMPHATQNGDVAADVNSNAFGGHHPQQQHHHHHHHQGVLPHAPNYMRRPDAGFVPPPAPFLPHYQPRFGYGRGGYMQKYAPRFQPPPHFHPSIYDGGLISMGPCKITLIVGTQKFVGTGRTLQQAKHNAAAQALQVLKAQQVTQEEQALNNTQDEETDDKKSPISLVHEIGIKRDLSVRFKVLREEGPAHMRKFITACMVGEFVTEGEGNGKKISKKRAAEKMLVQLKTLPPLSPPKSPTRRIKVRTPGKFSLGAVAMTATPKSERKRRFFAKDKSAENSLLQEEENPVTQLLQLSQARKVAEPAFEIVSKNGSEYARRKEFIVEVTFMNMVARGVGVNKKIAKKNAAQNMLDLLQDVDSGKPKEQEPMKMLSVEKSTKEDEQPATKEKAEEPETTTTKKETKFELPLVDTTAGQIPGILILRPNKKNHLKKKLPANNSQENDKVPSKINTNDELPTTSETTTTTKAASETNCTENNKSATGKSASVTNSIMKEQLLYLSKLIGFEVCFNDYPKGGSHSDFLTIITLSTEPPQICHGTGSSSEESQNDAAQNALKILSELGLSSAKT